MKNVTTEVKRITPRKAAAKVDADKAAAKAEVKAEVKAAPKASVMSKVAGAATKFFVFVEGARPTSGVRLAAHTDAALRFLGLAEQKPVRKNAVVALMGPVAVKYHTGLGNMADKAENVILTHKGYNFFKSRVEGGKIDGKLSAAYLAAISKGTLSAEAGIRENHLVPVGLVLR